MSNICIYCDHLETNHHPICVTVKHPTLVPKAKCLDHLANLKRIRAKIDQGKATPQEEAEYYSNKEVAWGTAMLLTT